MTSMKTSAESAVVAGIPNMDSANKAPWYKQHELRKLYFLMPFLFLGSTTLGYDGSVLNGLQTMDTWQSCMYCFLIQKTCPQKKKKGLANMYTG